MKAVAAVLPFRVNTYVLDELIRWEQIPDDPIFQLTFPQRGMLDPGDFSRMMDLHRRGAPSREIDAAAREIQLRLNPHPAGQMELNVPRLGDEALGSTSTARPSSSSRARVRLATPTARTASAGPSSSASTSSSSRAARRSGSSSTCASTPRSRACSSRGAIP
jgi:hypothetical protein